MNTEIIVLGGGCFWCVEAVFQQVRGVRKVTSGYAGGSSEDANYRAVSSGVTGHAEVVKVEFDPYQVSLETILKIFWHVHDPTTLNRQGADVGSQYRSVIFCGNAGQEFVAKRVLEQVQSDWSSPIVTQIRTLHEFFPAEDYHQNYFNNHPEAGYCQVVINPKVAKFRQQFAEALVG